MWARTHGHPQLFRAGDHDAAQGARYMFTGRGKVCTTDRGGGERDAPRAGRPLARRHIRRGGFHRRLARCRMPVQGWNVRVSVRGLGGSGAAVAVAVAQAGVAKLTLHYLDIGTQERLSDRLQACLPTVRITTGISSDSPFDAVVNATPQGMRSTGPAIRSCRVAARNLACRRHHQARNDTVARARRRHRASRAHGKTHASRPDTTRSGVFRI